MIKDLPFWVIAAVAAVVVLLSFLLDREGRKAFRDDRLLHAAFWFWGSLQGKAFGYLAVLVARTPEKIPPTLADTLKTLGVISGGVQFVLVFMVFLTPLMLRALETRGFTSFVGARHVSASKSGFLTVISILSIWGVALSTCALCSVTSIMGGFGHDLKRKILGNNAHIIVDVTRMGGFKDWRERLDGVRIALAKAGGGAATPVVGGEAMGSSSTNTAGVLVRGIDPETIGQVIDLPKNIEVGKFDYLKTPDKLVSLPPEEVIGRGMNGEPYLKGPDLRFSAPMDPSVKDFLAQGSKAYPAIIIGRELAKSLHVYVGDEVTLLSPIGELGPTGVMPKSRRFRVAAIFYSGMYEYDATHAYMLLHEAQKFFGMLDQDKITHIDVRVPEPEKVGDFRPAVEAATMALPFEGERGAAIRVRDWIEMNKNLFSALKLEKLATFLILCIAIAVAAMCILCTLLLMVTEKGKEIAILKALGASDGAIMRIFMLEGLIIGGIGTVLGVTGALGYCSGLAKAGVRLDPNVYYIDRLPVHVDLRDYGLVSLAAFGICMLFTLYPAYAASRLPPVENLRWE